jgi:antitoxin HicB
MRTFAYRARFEPGDHRGVVVSFPDVPEAITEGRDEAEAYVQAEEALGLALLTYPVRGLPVPKPRARGAGLVSITVEPGIAAKLALLEAIREKGLSQRAFARLIGKDEKEARRILDPRHATKLATLTAALRKLGQRLVIAVEAEHREQSPAGHSAAV